jgi:hypothetical protein
LLAERELALSSFINQLQSVAKDLAEDDSDAVRLMSMARSKGLTVDTAILLGVDSDTVPSPRREFRGGASDPLCGDDSCDRVLRNHICPTPNRTHRQAWGGGTKENPFRLSHGTTWRAESPGWPCVRRVSLSRTLGVRIQILPVEFGRRAEPPRVAVLL